jgi:hypothetical protein
MTASGRVDELDGAAGQAEIAGAVSVCFCRGQQTDANFGMALDAAAFTVAFTIGLAHALWTALHWPVAPRCFAKRPGETECEALDRITGHHFVGEAFDRHCAWCGADLEPERMYATTCRGSHREPWWLRTLRFIAV